MLYIVNERSYNPTLWRLYGAQIPDSVSDGEPQTAAIVRRQMS